MNDAGLCIGQNEILKAGDDSPKYNPLGIPMALAAHRLMEECKDLDEAEKLIREMTWTTATLFAMADRNEGRIFEITPKTVHVRKANNSFCAATNHFRTDGLKVADEFPCWRWPRLETSSQFTKPFGVKDVQDTLDYVNAGNYTLQSMVFEPGPLRLHVALGEPPVTKLPYREIDLSCATKARVPRGCPTLQIGHRSPLFVRSRLRDSDMESPRGRRAPDLREIHRHPIGLPRAEAT